MIDICGERCINQDRVNETVAHLPLQEEIDEVADIFKVLSDPSRLKIVLALQNQEHCVCDIAVICGQTESAVSHQLRLLRTQKIVKNRREGKIIYYSLDDDHVKALIDMSLDHVRHN